MNNDADDARRFRFLCDNPNWSFIEAMLGFVSESRGEFYRCLCEAIDCAAPDFFGRVILIPIPTATDAQGVGEAPKAVAEPEPMFYGRWHHGNGNLCCGSMRYFRADFDTNPAPDVREGIFDWICTTMNAALDRWREQKRAREEIEFGESPTASTTAGLTEAERLTDTQIEEGRRETFSTDNPYCPCDSKTMRKAVRWAERACAEKWNVRLDGGAAK